MSLGQTHLLRLWHRDGFGLANLLPAGEVPLVGKATALLGFDRVDSARFTVEHDTLVIFFFDQRKTISVHPETGVLIDKRLGLHTEELGDFFNLIIFYTYVARPFTAGGAAVALIPDVGHFVRSQLSGGRVSGFRVISAADQLQWLYFSDRSYSESS